MVVRYTFINSVIAASAVYQMRCLSSQMMVLHFAVALFSGCAITTAIIAGWSYSYGDRSGTVEAVRTCLRTGVVLSLIVMVFVLVFSEPINDSVGNVFDEAESSLWCLRLFALSIPTTTFSVSLIYSFQSTGRVLFATIMTVVRGALLMILNLSAMELYLNEEAIWISFVSCDLGALLIIFVISALHKHGIPRNLDDILMADTAFKNAAVCEESIDSCCIDGFRRRLPGLLDSAGLMPNKTADPLERLDRLLTSLASKNEDFRLRIVIRNDGRTTVQDDSSALENLPPGVKHKAAFGLNTYSLKLVDEHPS